MRAHQILCDECGKVLEGSDKGKYIQKSYLQFKGRMAMELFNEVMQKREYFFITPREDVEVALCGLDCLKSLIERKHTEHDQKMENRSRAGEDPYGLDTKVTDRPFIVGTKRT